MDGSKDRDRADPDKEKAKQDEPFSAYVPAKVP